MDKMELYQDIAKRTQGDIYIGVVGPVRTGKSTFIKRFIDLLVLPGIENEHVRARVADELPQSGAGKTIMTTQPRFVPNEAIRLELGENAACNVRLVDCVGYWVPGAIGHMEGETPRMVRTPWFDHEIPFEDAAELGTGKVIKDHSTIGIVMTTDGSITDLPRESYPEAEERVIRELKETGKPFVIVLNSTDPGSARCRLIREELMEKYGVSVVALDTLNMSGEAAADLLEHVLMEFPLSLLHIQLPGYLMQLDPGHWLLQRVLAPVKEAAPRLSRMRDYAMLRDALAGLEDFAPARVDLLELGTGKVALTLEPAEGMFYRILSEQTGYEITDDFDLFSALKSFSLAKRAYDRISGALDAAQTLGYGMVPPAMDEMALEDPEIVQQGNRFGVRLRANASAMQIFRIDMHTEINPIVGSAEQSEALVQYLMETFEQNPGAIWQTNIFGKPLYDLVRDNMSGKVSRMPDNVQEKLQRTLQRIVNDGCNGLICIIL
ncbi:MAG: stage IV sporulation protein A [Clostridiales bacterium]|jgi:stage IV sporulation protein A|nr:stage IV sporulation protein A [Clostridiales bacterium]